MMSYNPNEIRGPDGRWTGDLIERLEAKLKSKGVAPGEIHKAAIETLTKSGSLKPGTEEYTAQGLARIKMGAAERAKDRAARHAGRKPEDYAHRKGRVWVK